MYKSLIILFLLFASCSNLSDEIPETVEPIDTSTPTESSTTTSTPTESSTTTSTPTESSTTTSTPTESSTTTSTPTESSTTTTTTTVPDTTTTSTTTTTTSTTTTTTSTTTTTTSTTTTTTSTTTTTTVPDTTTTSTTTTTTSTTTTTTVPDTTTTSTTTTTTTTLPPSNILLQTSGSISSSFNPPGGAYYYWTGTANSTEFKMIFSGGGSTGPCNGPSESISTYYGNFWGLQLNFSNNIYQHMRIGEIDCSNTSIYTQTGQLNHSGNDITGDINGQNVVASCLNFFWDNINSYCSGTVGSESFTINWYGGSNTLSGSGSNSAILVGIYAWKLGTWNSP